MRNPDGQASGLRSFALFRLGARCMIFLYSGTPGSGKTLHAVKDMLTFNRKGWPVIANFNLNSASLRNAENVHWLTNALLNPKMLEVFAKDYWKRNGGAVKENRILLVIDEAQLVFNAREWQKNKNWIGFFTQHRKMGFQIILIAQSREMIDKQIRALFEYEYKHRVLMNAGIIGILVSLFLGSKFLYKKELAQVRTVGKGANLGFKIAYYGRRTYRAYDTFKTW